MRADCLRVMPEVAAASIDLVLCDLPYGLTDSPRDQTVLPMPRVWAHYERLLKPRGTVVLFAQPPFCFQLLSSAPRNWFRYEWIWDKHAASGFQWANQRPMRRHEVLMVFAPAPPPYHPQGLVKLEKARVRRTEQRGECYGSIPKGAQRLTGYPQSILHFGREMGARAFQKPTALLAYLIHAYTQPGDLVLDNTMGTGSTAVACVETGRRFVGMEKDRTAYRIAERRVTAALAARAAVEAK